MARKIMPNKKKIRNLGYPTMQGVFREWETDIEIVDRHKAIDENGFNVVSEVYRKVKAVVKPLEMSAIMIKPEALRERRWIFVYIETSFQSFASRPFYKEKHDSASYTQNFKELEPDNLSS